MNGEAVKVFCFLPRKRALSEDEFHAHWRHPHGTLAKDIETFARYHQAHRIDANGVPGLDTRHDGVAELWFATLDDGLGLGENRYYAEVVIPDEPNFIELGPDAFRVLTREEAVAERDFDPARRGVKLLQGIRRPQDLDAEAFHARFPGDDEEALGIELGATRHVVCRAMPETYGDEYVPFDGRHHQWLTPEPFDAVRELWWPSAEAFADAVGRAPGAWERLLDSPLVDARRSEAFVAEEHIVIA